MLATRITHAAVAQNALANMQAAYARAGKLSDQLSSGRKLQVPSDDPSGAVAALGLRADARAQAQYSRNADDGLSWLNITDTALQSASSELRNAYVALIQGANSGVMNSDSRAAIASQIRANKDELIALANATYLDRPVFGGATTNTQAFAATPDGTGAYAFLGDTATVSRRLDDNTTVRVDTPAASAFIDPATGKSLFQSLDEIAARVESGADVSADITAMKGFAKQLTTAMADVGARQNRVQTLQNSANDAGISLQASISGIEDVDIAKTMMDLQMANMGYQASLGATSKVIQRTLLDFLT